MCKIALKSGKTFPSKAVREGFVKMKSFSSFLEENSLCWACMKLKFSHLSDNELVILCRVKYQEVPHISTFKSFQTKCLIYDWKVGIERFFVNNFQIEKFKLIFRGNIFFCRLSRWKRFLRPLSRAIFRSKLDFWKS